MRYKLVSVTEHIRQNRSLAYLVLNVSNVEVKSSIELKLATDKCCLHRIQPIIASNALWRKVYCHVAMQSMIVGSMAIAKVKRLVIIKISWLADDVNTRFI